jgi:nickel-dependent lactate racemase
MKIPLAYGKQGLEVEVPDRHLVKVMTIPGATPTADPEAELRKLLALPIGGEPLASYASRATSACVVICDITRPVPNQVILPPILETLERSGIPRDRIIILIATGLHRGSTSDEIERMVGPEIQKRYVIRSHVARAAAEQRSLGRTKRGTPVFIDQAYCDADLKITTGFIEPHLMAGFSGGRKLVAPGCAGEETIKALHSPVFIEHPACREGSIDENPLHEELLEIAQMAGHDFIVNVSLDASHRMTGLFVGDPVVAHAQGVAHVRNAVRDTVREPVDVVVTTSAGYPLDLTFYQAVKGMTAALPVVKKGGTLIIAAECAEGLGGPEFTRMALSAGSAKEFLASLTRRPVVIDQWQLEECAKVVRDVEVVLVSRGIPEEHLQRLFIRSAASIEEAVREGLRRHGGSATVAVIPKGPYTLVDVEA